MCSSLRRLTALILPVALLSLFSVCLGLCATHVEGENLAAIDVAESDSCSGEDSECCSVTEGQSLLPDRVSYSVAPVRLVENPFRNISVNRDAHLSSAVSFTSSSPPLTLRI
jgi:hypothetical protein